MSIAALLCFLGALLLCLFTGWPVLLALGAGLICFALAVMRQGFSLRQVAALCLSGIRTVGGLLLVLFSIGLLTGLWRGGGTIPFLLYYGVRLIAPPLFVLSLFLLCALMSYLTGSSFGTVGTMGFVCMLLARLAGADTAACAGAILAGCYVGDRGSPMSSAASLVATLTGTRLYDNVRALRKSARLPLLITCLFYLILSLARPVQSVSPDLLEEMRQLFSLHPLALLPAVSVIVLCALRAPIYLNMLLSSSLALLLCLGIQKASLREALSWGIGGYAGAAGSPLAAVMNGGGVRSMLTGMGIVLLSSALFRLMDASGVLPRLQGLLQRLGNKTGVFGATLCAALLTSILSCSQTMAILLTHILCREQYDDPTALAVDLSNTAIVLSPLVPWNLACAIPLETLGVGWSAIPYAMFLWLFPLCALPARRGDGRGDSTAAPPE